jgi:hypothetical protein
VLTQQDLDKFIGTTQWFIHPLNPHITYTEGVQYLAEQGSAYWFLDIIVSLQHDRKVNSQRFQAWKLQVNLEEQTGLIVCEDGNYHEVFRQELAFTDFPLAEVMLFFTDNVILLPGEY